jgi:hypothetical protein
MECEAIGLRRRRGARLQSAHYPADAVVSDQRVTLTLVRPLPTFEYQELILWPRRGKTAAYIYSAKQRRLPFVEDALVDLRAI